MKKVLSILSTLAILIFCAFSVFAVQNDYTRQVLAALESGVETSGGTIYLPSQYINQARNYFNSDSCNMTQEQANQILADIADMKATIKESGVTSLSEIKNNTELRNTIMEKSKHACAVMGLTINFDSGKATITDAQGNEVGNSSSSVTVTDSNGNVVFKTDSVVKKTGENVDIKNAAIISIFAVSIIGTALFGAYRLKNSEM